MDGEYPTSFRPHLNRRSSYSQRRPPASPSGLHPKLSLNGYSHVEMWLLKVVVGRWFWNVVSKCFEGFEDVSAALHSPDEEANNNNTSNKLGGHVGFWKPFIKTV
ncbi:hypothetical protein MRB53_027555 [Persea americana]|uniref:Uncharacterized protein n=1 Tax=Persea americana TaxID=3435 RepID=A0ACC2LLC0_PERAE|nr:hypothetical protein MRB53_027555 [Persea americana]